MSDEERPAAWITGRPNLVAAFPTHVPMGLPLPAKEQKEDKPDEEYTL